MSYKRNTAITGFPFGLVSATDGSAVTTGTPVIYYVLDGATQGTVAGSATHEGNGQWSVNLTAGEMNGSIVGILVTETGSVPVHFTIKTDTKIVSELNDITTASVVSGGAITTAGGAVSNVTTVATNTDMRGTDNALLAASAPTNWGDLAITATTGLVSAGTVGDKTGYSISGTLTTLDALENITTAQVNAEVVDALNVDTYAEPGQGNPLATTSLVAKIGYIYKTLRNKKTSSATSIEIYNDAGTVVDQKRAISDDATTYTENEIITGP